MKGGQKVKELFTDEGFVTVEYQREVQQLLNHWKLGFWRRLVEWFKSDSIYKYRGNLLEIHPAPEPSDILWENAGTPAASLFFRRLISFILSVGILVGFGIVIFIINGEKDVLLEALNTPNDDADGIPEENQDQISFITFVCSIFVVLVNYLLRVLILVLVDFSKYPTSTDALKIYSEYLAWSQFVNTALVTTFVSTIFNNVWGPGGLVMTVFQIHVSITIIGWAFDCLDIKYLYRYCRRRNARTKNANGQKLLYTQEELNA